MPKRLTERYDVQARRLLRGNPSLLIDTIDRIVPGGTVFHVLADTPGQEEDLFLVLIDGAQIVGFELPHAPGSVPVDVEITPFDAYRRQSGQEHRKFLDKAAEDARAILALGSGASDAPVPPPRWSMSPAFDPSKRRKPRWPNFVVALLLLAALFALPLLWVKWQMVRQAETAKAEGSPRIQRALLGRILVGPEALEDFDYGVNFWNDEGDIRWTYRVPPALYAQLRRTCRPDPDFSRCYVASRRLQDQEMDWWIAIDNGRLQVVEWRN